MITAKQFQELVSFRTPSDSVLSVYLDADAQDDGPGLERRLRALARHERFQAAEADIERAARYLCEEFEPGRARCVALFSAKRFGLWRACALPQPVSARAVLGDKPWLAPLASIADQHHRFGVILADNARARFLEVFMGEIHEHADMALTAADAARAGFSGQHPYLRFLTDRLDALARKQGFQRVIIGVSPDMALRLVNHLHSSLQQSLILDADLGPDLDLPSVLERIAACEREARKVKETVLVHKLLDAIDSSRLAVTGLERTLDAFRRGQVKVLLVRDGFTKMGRVCPGCGTLSLDWPKCFDCRRPTEAVFDIVGEMMQRAYDLNCEVVRLMHETPLDNVGRIAAHLSHAPEDAPAAKRGAPAARPQTTPAIAPAIMPNPLAA